MTGKKKLIDLCKSDVQMQWINLPPDEQLDLKKFVDGHSNILYVGKEKALFISLEWVLLMEQKIIPLFSRNNLC